MIAPGAKIVLIEANDDGYDNLMAAVEQARTLPDVSVVSMSFGSGEMGNETDYDSHFTTPSGHLGMTFLASTGDHGSPGGCPAYSPYVIAVGGTTLNLNGTTYSETGWTGSGGGQSTQDSEPPFQNGVQSSGQRQTPDVSFVANPNTGVPVYDSYEAGSAAPWIQVGGTSLLGALLGRPDRHRRPTARPRPRDFGRKHARPWPPSRLPAADYHDINSSPQVSNGSYSTGPGYDMVTGIGSPVANLLVAPAWRQRFVPASMCKATV